MSNKEINTSRSFKKPTNKQEELANGLTTNEARQSTLNHGHNTKKEAEGPNTKR